MYYLNTYITFAYNPGVLFGAFFLFGVRMNVFFNGVKNQKIKILKQIVHLTRVN